MSPSRTSRRVRPEFHRLYDTRAREESSHLATIFSVCLASSSHLQEKLQKWMSLFPLCKYKNWDDSCKQLSPGLTFVAEQFHIHSVPLHSASCPQLGDHSTRAIHRCAQREGQRWHLLEATIFNLRNPRLRRLLGDCRYRVWWAMLLSFSRWRRGKVSTGSGRGTCELQTRLLHGILLLLQFPDYDICECADWCLIFFMDELLFILWMHFLYEL